MADYELGTAQGSIILNTSQLARAEGALKLVGNRMVAMGALAVAGFGLAVKASADFEQQLSRFQAVADASGKQMDKIREKALQLGRDSAYGATEVIEAFAELGYAGVTTKEILDGMGDAVVYLAAAAEVDMKDAATGLVNTMRQFHIPAKNAVDVVNELARASNASTLDMKDLITSLRYAGPVAAALNLPLRDVAQTLAILGNNGIRGSTGGTSLRGVLIALTPTSEKAASKMRELGLITEKGANLFFDAQGKMKSMAEVSQILQDHTKNLSDELKKEAFTVIFQRRAMASAIVLADGGAKAYKDLASSAQYNVTAQELMEKKLDNLNGSIKILKASLETMAISFGSAFQGPLKFVADTLRDLTNVFIKLPQPVQTAMASMLLLGGAFLLVGGLMSRIGASAIKAWVAFKELGNGVKIAYQIIANGGGAVGMLGRLAAAAGAFAVGWYIGSQIIEHFGATGWKDMNEALGRTLHATDRLSKATEGDLLPTFEKEITTTVKTVDAWNKLVDVWDHGEHHIPVLKDKFRLLGEQLRLFKDLAKENYAQAQLLFLQMERAGYSMGPFKQILKDLAPEQKTLNEQQEIASDKVKIMTGSYDDAIDALNKYQDALKGTIDKELDYESAVLDQQDALAEFVKAQAEAAAAGGQDAEKNEAMARALIALKKQVEDTAFALRDKRQADLEAEGALDAHGRASYEMIQSLMEFRDTLDPGSPLRTWLDQYILKLGEASTKNLDVNAQPAIDALETAYKQALKYQQKLDEIGYGFLAPTPLPPGIANPNPPGNLSFLNDPNNPVNQFLDSLVHKAKGGRASGTFWAGEEGQELVSLGAGQSAYVTAYPEVMKMAMALQKVKQLQASMKTNSFGGPRSGSDQALVGMMGAILSAIQNMDGPLVGELNLNGTGSTSSDAMEMVRELRSLSWRGGRGRR